MLGRGVLLRRLATALAAPLVMACGPDLGPDLGDPTEFTFVDATGFVCGRWYPTQPTVEHGLFDVYWDGTPDMRLDDSYVQRVVEAGGRVVHRYQVRMLRAILPIVSVPGLEAGTVRGVVDPERLDVEVFVHFTDGIDSDLIGRLGGTITHEFPTLAFVAAIVPDAAIPRLRSAANVELVEVGGTLCLAGEPGVPPPPPVQPPPD